MADAVWFYEEPFEAVGAIAGRVAFYPSTLRSPPRPSPTDGPARGWSGFPSTRRSTPTPSPTPT
ncbi:DUF427 domain-containing protein [Streptomyces sp. NPDC001220]